MTKAERAQLARGINPLTGTRIAREAAAATASVPWVAEAKLVAEPVAAPLDRPWTFLRTEPTNSGNGRTKDVFQSVMRNGGAFESTIASDLVRALRAGKVIGLK